MSVCNVAALARVIAADLFTNSVGERAARLVMESGGSAGRLAGDSLGGWSETAVADRIERALREHRVVLPSSIDVP